MKRYMSHVRQVTGLILLLLVVFAAGCGDQKEPDFPTTATPDAPYRIVSTTSTRGIALDIELMENKLYVAENGYGITRYDLSDRNHPALEYQYSTMQRVDFIKLAPWNNFLVVGLGDRFQLFLMGDTLRTTDYIQYVDSEDLLMIPDSSRQLSSFLFDSLDTVGTRLLRTDREEGVHCTYIYPDSVSSPPADYFVGYVAPPVRTNRYGTGALGIATIDSMYTLAVALKDVGVGILQMGEEPIAAETSWLTDVDTPGEATKLIHQNGYLYVADGAAGLAVLDVRNIEAPAITSTWTYPGLGHANNIAVQGNHLVLIDRFDGAFFFDLTNPAEPEFVGMYDVREPTDAVFYETGELLLSSVTEGLTVLQLLY